MKTAGILLAIVLALCIGYWFGQHLIKVAETTVVEYYAMPTISVSVSPAPRRFTVPDVPHFIWRTDTVQRQIIDTAAILADWTMKREYADRLIEDSTGTIDYTAIVQYNRLQNISLDYTPIQRIVTTTKVIKERWAPLLFVGGNSAGYVTVEGGIFIGKYGFSAELGQNMFGNERYIGGKIGMRF
ncbi:MAG: hypothetical protein LBD52_07540 [Prevotellaceae bacterium]|jgi:hypothetical protein|nr:hypothetical protein [Prevotellaceae bacterium]